MELTDKQLLGIKLNCYSSTMFPEKKNLLKE